MVDYPYPASFLAPLPAYPVKASCQSIMAEDNRAIGLAQGAGKGLAMAGGGEGSIAMAGGGEGYLAMPLVTGLGRGP